MRATRYSRSSVGRPADLRAVQLGVEAAAGQQFAVRAALDDPSVVDHEDAIGVDDRRQAVRDDDRGSAAQDLVERLLDRELRLGVEVRRRLVEDHDRGILEQQTRDRESLLLAARHAVAALADDGVEAVGQRLDEVPDARRAQHAFDVGVGRVGLGEEQVGADGLVEEVRVLRARDRSRRATSRA